MQLDFLLLATILAPQLYVSAPPNEEEYFYLMAVPPKSMPNEGWSAHSQRTTNWALGSQPFPCESETGGYRRAQSLPLPPTTSSAQSNQETKNKTCAQIYDILFRPAYLSSDPDHWIKVPASKFRYGFPVPSSSFHPGILAASPTEIDDNQPDGSYRTKKGRLFLYTGRVESLNIDDSGCQGYRKSFIEVMQRVVVEPPRGTRWRPASFLPIQPMTTTFRLTLPKTALIKEQQIISLPQISLSGYWHGLSIFDTHITQCAERDTSMLLMPAPPHFDQDDHRFVELEFRLVPVRNFAGTGPPIATKTPSSKSAPKPEKNGKSYHPFLKGTSTHF